MIGDGRNMIGDGKNMIGDGKNMIGGHKHRSCFLGHDSPLEREAGKKHDHMIT
jgi:hypothetical protein